MLVLVGIGVVVACVFGGYLAGGGHMVVLWQPMELVIILGASIGAFVTAQASQPHVLKETAAALTDLLGNKKPGKRDYLELLSVLYALFRLIKGKGELAIEPHVERPQESELFQRFPRFLANHDGVHFICDYLRLITMGSRNPFEIDALMAEEIETMRQDGAHVPHAIQTMADGMPALGIVAAVLGVIHTMGAIKEPPEVLGHMIGGALVGTFLGVLLAYGLIGPMAAGVKGISAARLKYVECIRQGLLAHLNGCAPPVAVEFARKVLSHDVRPSFSEVETATSAVVDIATARKAA